MQRNIRCRSSRVRVVTTEMIILLRFLLFFFSALVTCCGNFSRLLKHVRVRRKRIVLEESFARASCLVTLSKFSRSKCSRGPWRRTITLAPRWHVHKLLSAPEKRYAKVFPLVNHNKTFVYSALYTYTETRRRGE
uniref:Uncharacterized protein n=1 Tax=Sipha flava TaxID=143950 RepID=A0A2S2PXS1_9HEMI